MQLIYSNENSILVGNIKNLLEINGIEVVTKNEYAYGAAGDLSSFDAWIELWVSEAMVPLAQQIINDAESKTGQQDWFCAQCKERNGGNFEICWQCHHKQA